MALMFAETWYGAGCPAVRQMIVKINGAPVTQAGPNGLLDVFVKARGLYKPVYLNVGSHASQNGFITVTCERVEQPDDQWNHYQRRERRRAFLLPAESAESDGSDRYSSEVQLRAF